jgi:MFS family permease
LVEGQRRAFTRPAVFLFLFLPFGVIPGYVVVTLGYLLAKAGVSVEAVAGLVALAVLPHAWKALWAPLVDTTLSARRWYVLAAVISTPCLLAMGLVRPDGNSLALLSGLILASSLAGTFIGMSTESLMAHTVADDSKGRASGWAQAGNVAGTGIGGGAALWLAIHYAGWIGSGVLALTNLACCAALLFVARPQTLMHVAGALRGVKEVARDVWVIARSRGGFLALLLLVLPVGSGGAPQLVAAIAGDWQADGDTVALARGVLGGLVAVAGSLLGGYLSDRMDRKTAYLSFGVALALCAAAMALAPHTPHMFLLFVCLYSFINGIVFAGFSAVVLEAIGTGAAATKFSLMASLANLPAVYMTWLDGHIQTRWGSNALLFTDAAFGIVGAAIFLVVAAATKNNHAGKGKSAVQA